MAFCYRAAIILLLSSGSLIGAAAVVQEDAHDLERKVDQVFAATSGKASGFSRG